MSKLFAVIAFLKSICSVNIILADVGVMVMMRVEQGCISCGILLSGTGARGVSSEHMENMEMFSCSPTSVRSDFQRT